MAFNRWEWLEGLKPESPITVALKFMAEQISQELTKWPPEVTVAAGQDRAGYSELLAAGSPRPSLPAFAEAIKRARWELERNFDAIDFYERNHHLAKACPSPRDQEASVFIQHYILESFFMLMERTEYRVKRKDALLGVDMLERHLKLRQLS
jgi:hypothetical protein